MEIFGKSIFGGGKQEEITEKELMDMKDDSKKEEKQEEKPIFVATSEPRISKTDTVMSKVFGSMGKALSFEESKDGKTNFESKRDSYSDIFDVPQPDDADIYSDDLVAPPEEPKIDDLVSAGEYSDNKDLFNAPDFQGYDDLTEIGEDLFETGYEKPELENHWSDEDIQMMQRQNNRKPKTKPKFAIKRIPVPSQPSIIVTKG